MGVMDDWNWESWQMMYWYDERKKKDEFIKLCRERANKKNNLNYVKQYIKKFCKPYDFVKEGSFIVAYSKY